VAPGAGQRAAFEENGGSDTGPVVHRAPLDVEDPSSRNGRIYRNCVHCHSPLDIR
jgi:hypothetical protein